MKKTLLAFATLALLSSSAFASELVKSCQFKLPSLDDENIEIQQNIKVFKDKDDYTAEVIQTIEGYSHPSTYSAEFNIHTIKEDLKTDISDEEIDSLNPGELLIVHAMTVQEDEILGEIFDSGIKDLSKVRKVKTYLIGETTNMGSTTIVEAFDKDGNILGSFLGGFIVAPCK